MAIGCPTLERLKACIITFNNFDHFGANFGLLRARSYFSLKIISREILV